MVKLASRFLVVVGLGASVVGCSLDGWGEGGGEALEIGHGHYEVVESTPTTLRATGVVARDEAHLFGFSPPAGATILSVQLDGDGDADLYTRFEEEPTLEAFACRPYIDGSQEHCEHFDGRDMFVKVRGWATYSNYELVIEVKGISTSP